MGPAAGERPSPGRFSGPLLMWQLMAGRPSACYPALSVRGAHLTGVQGQIPQAE